MFILILIPTLAFAQHPDDQLENKLFGDLDEDSDSKITEREYEDNILNLDADKGDIIHKIELPARVDKSDAGFVGHVDALYGLRDRDSNRHVDNNDIDLDFHLDDYNLVGRIEYQERYVIFHLVVASNVG